MKLVCLLSLALLIAACGDGRSANDGPSPELVSETEAVDYAVIKAKIFETSQCLKCHSGPNPEKNLDLSTYATMMARNVVRPGSAELSPLYTLVRDGIMPDGGPPLRADLVALIKRWIDEGAVEKIQ